jgi:GR25 family glycosyltransferase involved in LPS biosynthesis
MAKENNDFALILEDDAVFFLLKFSGRTIREIIDAAPKDWQIIQLATIRKKMYDPSRDLFFPLGKQHLGTGTAAYLVNLQNMKDYKDNPPLFPEMGAADYYIYDIYKTYIYNFPLFITNDFKFEPAVAGHKGVMEVE